jgi:hypothetical protein
MIHCLKRKIKRIEKMDASLLKCWTHSEEMAGIGIVGRRGFEIPAFLGTGMPQLRKDRKTPSGASLLGKEADP